MGGGTPHVAATITSAIQEVNGHNVFQNGTRNLTARSPFVRLARPRSERIVY